MVFPTFFNLSLNLAIRNSWSEPQSAPSLVFADCIELLHLAAKNIINLIMVLTIWWCPCVRSHHFMANDGNAVQMADFIFLGSQITADGDCSHEIKRRLLLVRKVMTNLDSILKSWDITLSRKVHLVKAIVFPVIMYGHESWTIKKAECWRIDAFELCCWRRLLRFSWTPRISNQSILKEISPGCSLVGLMLKLKLQYFVHLMRRVTHLKRSWCWEWFRAGGEGDDRGWDGLMASLTQWTWVWVVSGSWWWTGRPGVLWFNWSHRVGHYWVTELNWTLWKKSYDLPRWHIKKQTLITLPTKVRLLKAMISPVVTYVCEISFYKESWALKNWGLWTVVLEKTLLHTLNYKEIQQVHPKGNQSWMFLEGLMLKLKLQYFGHLCKELTHLKKPWCWERLKTGRKGDDRGWDSWRASLTQWTWVWVNSGSWWWTGRPGVLQSLGLQRVRHDWVSELNQWI